MAVLVFFEGAFFRYEVQLKLDSRLKISEYSISYSKGIFRRPFCANGIWIPQHSWQKEARILRPAWQAT